MHLSCLAKNYSCFLVLVAFLTIPSLAIAQNKTPETKFESIGPTIITGQVNSNGKPLPFATIKVEETNTGTLADKNGAFSISLPFGNYIFEVSAVGYKSQKLKIKHIGTKKTSFTLDLQESNTNLSEVVVTGASRKSELRKNPIAIVVLAHSQLLEISSSNAIDAVVKGVPGVSAVSTGPNISKPYIRGLGYNRVLTLYNGIRQEGQQWGDEHGIEIDQNAIGRVEVIKGPASLAYGSDALAGVINFIPFIPSRLDTNFSAEILTAYQTNNHQIATSAAATVYRNNWRYMLRLSQKNATDYRNAVDGYVYNTGYSEANLTAIAQLNTKWGTSETGLTLYNNFQEIPDGARDSTTRAFTYQALEIPFDNVKSRPYVHSNDFKSYAIAPLHQLIQHARIYNNTDITLGKGSIGLTFGLQQSIRQEFNHPTATKQPGLNVALTTLTYGAKYNFPEIKGYNFTIGGNGMFQNNTNGNGTDFPIPDYNLIDVGGYVFASKSINKYTFSSGVRLDNRSVNWNDFYVGHKQGQSFDSKADGNSPNDVLQFPKFNKDFSGVSSSLGVTYNISDRLLAKANIANGYRAPNITEIGSNGLDPGAKIVYLGNRSFNPETNTQVDAGFMAYLNQLDISVEVFLNNVNNYIYQARLTDNAGNPIVIVPGNLTYQYQQGKARLYGTEISINWHPTWMANWTLNNSLAYVVGTNQDKVAVAKSNDMAKYLPFIPPLHTRSELKYSLKNLVPMLHKAYLKLEVDLYANQDKFYSLDNTETRTPGYTLFNICAGTTISKRKGADLINIYLQADNVLNTIFQSNLSRLKYFEYYNSSPNQRSGIYGMGRNLSVKLIFHI